MNGYSLLGECLRAHGFETSVLPELEPGIGEELLAHSTSLYCRASAGRSMLRHTLPEVASQTTRLACRPGQASIRRDSWRVPRIFDIIQKGGSVSPAEMHNVFNMGIGMVLVVPGKRATEAVRRTHGRRIGEIVEGSQVVALV
jgi:phosphoribosylformylglycinamidine cyclo-ligase